jgi:ParB family transcriptional regulator, chromosome partitioning protein
MKVEEYAVSRIHADEDFNCRGYISPADVYDLAKDIEQNTLQQPITIQPYDEAKRKATGFDFRIIQGHRRFTAMSVVLKWDKVPAIIVEGLSETEALIRNLGENLQREKLNIVQEARALKRLKDAGLTQAEIATRLRMQRPWVQTRLYVLDFPEDIQDEISKGVLTQAQIHEVHQLPGDQWYPAVRQIKAAKERLGGKKVKPNLKALKTPKAEDMLKAKARKQEEIVLMMEHLYDNSEPGLHTRVLSWAAGEINTMDLLRDFKAFCDREGYNYHIPTDGIAGL